jgi:hypothetical protein
MRDGCTSALENHLRNRSNSFPRMDLRLKCGERLLALVARASTISQRSVERWPRGSGPAHHEAIEQDSVVIALIAAARSESRQCFPNPFWVTHALRGQLAEWRASVE